MSMGPYPKAVILAGGRGSRLRTLGQVLPKCLLPVFDKPLLMYQIEQCAQAGVGEVLVATSARFEGSVRSTLALYTPPPAMTISCVTEAEPLGPILGLLLLVPSLGSEAVLVLLGDEYYEDSSPFLSLAQRTAVPDLLVGVVHDSAPQRILCNVVTDAAGRVMCVREKPDREQLVGSTRWCGCAGFGAGLLGSVPRDLLERSTHLGDLLSWLLTRGARAEALDFREIHLNLNTAEDALLASLVEARRRHRQEGRPPLQALDDTIETLLLAAAVPG
jgi:NDP-sugar pyrophosphorylase family protein